MSKLSLKVFHGRIVHCLEVKSVTVLEDGLIGIDSNGQILFVDEGANKDALMKQFDFNELDIHQLKSSQFLMPGFVDTHIHAPQYRFTGTGYDLQLMDWLKKYTFPTEAKFSDVPLASEVYQSVVKRTLNNGTTTASYFATIHVQSAIELCKIIAQYGQRALVGKVNMDRESPDNYIEDTSKSISDTVKFIEFVEGMKNPLIEAVITPRFLPTCTDELLKKLAELAKKKGLKIQSHLCEQLSEIDYTMKFYPSRSHQNCTQVFDDMGLLNEKTYMAHCIHLKEEELELMKERKVGIAHCPNSNFCLKSGLMDARDRLDPKRDLKIGLGTDVSGGFSSSMMDAIRHALQASRALHIKFEKEGKTYEQLTLDEALYMATIGGAKVLNLQDKIGNFEVGKEFDALLVDTAAVAGHSTGQLPVFDIFPCDSFEDILSKFIYLGDDRNIIKVFVAGREIIDKVHI